MQDGRAAWSGVVLTAMALVLAGCTTPTERPDDGDTGGTGAPPTTAPPPAGPPAATPPPSPPDPRTSWEGLRLPPGVQGEVVARNLSFPTGVDWDDDGTMYVAEVGFTEDGPRLVRIGADGRGVPLDLGDVNLTPQLLDVTYHDGVLYFTTTGIVWAHDLATNATREVITDLPAWGDHRTDEVLVGPDGRLYVSQGSVTNSGIMGLDQGGVPNAVDNVINDRPGYREIPCEDVRASGANYETFDVRNQTNVTLNAYDDAAADVRLVWRNGSADADADGTEGAAAPEGGRALTGPYAAFGTPRARGDTIPGEVRCTGSVLSSTLDGGDLRVVAWGFRNPFAMQFDEEGTLWVSNNGYDNRGSRPVGATPDELWRVPLDGDPMWFGYPDYSAGLPLTMPFFSPLYGPEPVPLFLEEPNEVPKPATFFSAHASANKFGVAPANSTWAGNVFIAEFGTLNIEFVRGALTGMDVARVDLETGRVTEFIVGEQRYSGHFRPVEATFGPDGRLYVVDFGQWIIRGVENATDPSGLETAPQGAAVTDNFVPGSGRVLAFTLPDDLDWEGFPAGNVGGDGTQTVNGTVRPTTDEEVHVRAVDYTFGGATTAQVGQPVVFRNEGEVGHTATEVANRFNSGFDFAPGTEFVWTPTEPGTFTYYCEVHPIMQGRITVEGDTQATGGGAPGDGGAGGNATAPGNGTSAGGGAHGNHTSGPYGAGSSGGTAGNGTSGNDTGGNGTGGNGTGP